MVFLFVLKTLKTYFFHPLIFFSPSEDLDKTRMLVVQLGTNVHGVHRLMPPEIFIFNKF